MSISHHVREASHAETAREMDRRGEVIERLEADNATQAAEITRLRAEVALMREALKPFAEEAGNWADTVPDAHRSLCTEPGSRTAHPGSETAFNVGDLRVARAARGPAE
jgi:hypothetical protein